MDKDKILAVIDELIDTLTLKRVGLITLLIAIGLALFFVFENRNTLFTKVFEHVNETEHIVSSWGLSEISKESLVNFAKSAPVAYINVIEVDLKKNRRVLRYRYVVNETLRKNFEEKSTNILPQAVFDHDAKNTQQMVAVLSNEFNCAKTTDTIYRRLFPDLINGIPTICRLAIPPFTGQFAGYLTIGLSREVSKNELDSIRLEVSRLAVEIYTRDVLKR